VPVRVLIPAQPEPKARSGVRVVTPAGEASRKPNVGDDVMGYLSVFNKTFPYLDEAGDALAAGADTLMQMRAGGGMGGRFDPVGNYRRRRELSARRAADFEARRPLVAANAKGAGIAAQIAPALLTAGASAAPQIAAQTAPRGLMGASARLLKPMADSAVVSGLTAQVAAYGGDGTLEERAETARETTLVPQPAPEFAPRAGPPRRIARASVWVRPEVVVEVAYREVTPDGVLRHPSLLRQRPDKRPRECEGWEQGAQNEQPIRHT